LLTTRNRKISKEELDRAIEEIMVVGNNGELGEIFENEIENQ
jgi:hypothetical protein